MLSLGHYFLILVIDMKTTIQFSKFDAELDTDVCDAQNNMDLTLILRLGFNQINPAGGAATGTYHDYGDATEPTRNIRSWSDGAWASWKSAFTRTAQSFWNGKFWLLNPSRLFAFEEGGVTYIPNVYCKMRIIAQDGTAINNHHTIDVVRLAASETWFGSHSTLYDSLDIRSTRKGVNDDGTPIMQRAHVHEVGHLLGLGHVDEGEAHCPTTGNTNASACYGLTDHNQNSVMGQGMQLRREHGQPWQKAMRRFAFNEATGRSNTAASLSQATIAALMGLGPVEGTRFWEVMMRRHYPRTPAEITAGTRVTAPRVVAP